ncbi:MerR family transcriptional regulator [Blastococcus sp. SYSU DS0541]
MTGRRMQIGEVAERTGLSVRTIRFYEESGLVVPSARTSGGFRLYTDGDVSRLQRIRRLKPLEFTLEEMRDVLGLLDEVTDQAGAADTPAAQLLERLAMYRELADQRVAALHDRWAAAAGFAEALCRHEQRLHRTREIHS